MKLNRIFIYLAAALSLSAVSCVKESPEIETYPRNEGEEYLNVVVDKTDTLFFLGRGNTLSFSVESSYDGTIEGADWVVLTSREFPGDKRAYTISAKAEANQTGNDREDKLVISTPNITKTIVVVQPAYNRPAIPEVIRTAEELATFLSEQAPYVEVNEEVKLGATIDMKDVTIEPAEYFNGILEGDGNSIINLKAATPLISVNNGVIRNVVIGEGSAFTVNPAVGRFGSLVGENKGIIDNCENRASMTLSETNNDKVYIGGIAGYNFEGASINNCRNYGAITVDKVKTTNNFYLGGMTGYSYGSFISCDNYGPIYVDVVDIATAQIFFGGISPRLETGTIKGCVNHKEAKVTVKGSGKSGNIYGGGLVGYHEGTSDICESSNFADIEVTLNNGNNYIAGLLGWQAKVTSAPFSILENCVVNCNMTGVKKAAGQYGINPTQSAGLVLGRFSGQANNQVCNVGTADKPVKVSGSVYCTETKTKVIANAKSFGDLVDGDGSATNLNSAGSTWQVFNCVYEVVGDGQTGPAEELIVTTDPIKLEVPMTGGKTSFIFKANYDATVSTTADWLSFSESEAVLEKVIPAADGEQTVEIFAAANSTAQDREGKVSVSLPMGSYKEITIFQPGNKVLEPEVAVSQESFTAQPAGDALSFTVTSNYDAVITTEDSWLTITPATTKGGDAAQTVNVTVAKNNGADAADRNGTITVSVSNFDSPAKTVTKTITVSQEKFVYIPKTEIATVDDFMDFIEYGGDAELYPSDFVVKLAADIDLKGKTVKSIPTFVATFDGQNHSLKNWACEGPLFGQVKNCVKNLVIDSSCKVNLKFENTVANGSNKCIGVICGDLLAGSIEGCTNNAAVTLATFGTDPTFLGVFSGRSQASAMVKGCVNNGAVTVKPTSAISASYRVAGIVGGSNGNVQDCTNNAPVELSPADITGGNHFLGGIVAYLAKNTDQVCAGCINTKNGKITFNPTAVTSIAQSYVGGCVGYLDGQLKADTNFSNDKNFGDVCSTANNELVAVGGLLGWSKGGGNPNNLLFNSVVNCNVTAGFASTDGSAVNPCQSAGLIIGRVALSSGAANVTAVCGSAEEPVKVAGSVTLNGGATVTATASNFLDLVKGSGFNDTNNKFTVNAVYEEVAKQ